MTKQSVFIFCGEPSAEIHGVNLVRSLKKKDPTLIFHGVGGEALKKEGVQIFRDNQGLAVIGFWEVLKKYGEFKKLMADVKEFILSQDFESVILIDYPGFNLRLAKEINKRKKVIYYISPQLWAWGGKRYEDIKQYVHHMLVIFEFEERLYQEKGIPVTYVGHPLMDELNFDPPKNNVENLIKMSAKETESPIIALLPGSRKMEVERHFPILIECAKKMEHLNFHFIVSAANEECQSRISELNEELSIKHQISPLMVYDGDVSELIAASHFVMVSSGTACLQTALYLKPMVVFYKVNPWFYYLMKYLIKLKNIAMVNLIAKKDSVPEFIQNDFNAENVYKKVKQILNDPKKYQQMKNDLTELKNKIGASGASERAAGVIIRMMNEKTG